MTMKSMKYSDCDTIMDGYNPVPPPLPRRVPPVRNIYAEPFASEANAARYDCFYLFYYILHIYFLTKGIFEKLKCIKHLRTLSFFLLA